MSDQPISSEELTMLEAATKAAMQYQDRLAVVVDPDIMRRLIMEVRSFRAIINTPGALSLTVKTALDRFRSDWKGELIHTTEIQVANEQPSGETQI